MLIDAETIVLWLIIIISFFILVFDYMDDGDGNGFVG